MIEQISGPVRLHTKQNPVMKVLKRTTENIETKCKHTSRQGNVEHWKRSMDERQAERKRRESEGIKENKSRGVQDDRLYARSPKTKEKTGANVSKVMKP